MGRIYVTDALIPTVRLLTDAYKQGLIDAGKAYNMAYGMAYHKEERETEERLSPCTPFYKEEKEKEERDLSLSHARKECLTNPTLNEVAEYAKMFYDAQKWAFGDRNHHYAVDPFHEGGIRPGDLSDDKICFEECHQIILI